MAITIEMSATLPSLLAINLLVVLLTTGLALSHGSRRVENSELTADNVEDDEAEMDADGWSPWAEWSPCSRSCDGGISRSNRKCLLHASSDRLGSKVTGCGGAHERYRLCNIQPCSVTIDFRAQQCSSFNEQPYRERYYRWSPYIDPSDPCALTCRAEGLGFVAKLDAVVKDGTRCKLGALDMCVAGKCMSVGCDLEIGSQARIDECGICGGDGSTCEKYSYRWWHHFPPERCSKTCGGGIEHSQVICIRDDANHTQVDEIYCSGLDKFRSQSRPCNILECPPEWVPQPWSECSRPCGQGAQKRSITCALLSANGSRIILEDGKCDSESRPPVEQKCNTHECPKWYSGAWSKCTGRCGNGIETRPVVCRDAQAFVSDSCETELKPSSERNCTDVSHCPQPEVYPDQVVTTDPRFVIGPWRECNTTCGLGYKNRTVQCQISLEFSRSLVVLEDSNCGHSVPIRLESCYEDKGCIKNETLVKQNYSEPSSGVLESFKLDMLEEYANRIEDSVYEWQVVNYTECSARCLGGTQDSIIACVDLAANVSVEEGKCVEEDRPDVYTRKCNQDSCPPYWNIGAWSQCSKPCGLGGRQSREVQCYHQLSRGIFNLAIIEDADCPQPKPPSEQACHEIDCPARWTTSPWSACTRDCGGGKKTRAIRCVREFALVGVKEVSPLECPARRPKTLKSCNLRSCRASSKSANESSRKSKRNHSLPQFHNIHMPGTMANASEKKITIKVGGEASAPEGGHIRLVCPMVESSPNEEAFDERRLEFNFRWFKDNRPVASSDENHGARKHRAFRNVLVVRSLQASDAGVYKCLYERDFHTMFLHVVKPKSIPKPSTTMGEHTHTGGNVTRFKKVKFLYVPPVLPQRWRDNDKDNQIEDDNGGEEVGMSNDVSFDWITTEWSMCTIECGGKGFRMRLVQCYSRRLNVTEVARDGKCFEVGLLKPTTIEGCGQNKCRDADEDLK